MINIANLRLLKIEIQKLIENENLEEAISIINKYENIYPYDLDIYTIKATIFFYNGKYEEAEKLLIDRYYKYEYNFEINYNLGIIYYYKGEYKKALEYFLKVLILENNESVNLDGFMENVLINISDDESNEVTRKVKAYFLNKQRSFPCDGDGKARFGEVVFKHKSNDYYCGAYDYYYPERDKLEIEYKGAITNLIKAEVIPSKVFNNFKCKLNEDIILPLMVKNNCQEVEININDQINNFENLLKDRFYYYKFNKNDELEIKSNKEFILGNKIEIKKNKKLPSLVLNIFIDGLSQKFIEENNLENIAPNIYKFFKEGTICNNTYVTGEWTYVSLASFFTGKTTTNHRVFHPNYDTNNLIRNELYSEIFQNEGYLTAKIDGDWRSNPAIGYMKGLDRYLYQPSVRDMHCDDVITETIEHLETFKNNNNFLWICIPDLHDVADEFETRISTQVRSSINCRAFEKSQETSVRKKKDDKKSERFGVQLKRIDTYLGLLFNYIKDNYNEDDFIVSLVADHGQGYLVKSDEFLDEERTKVAMMFRGKNIPKGYCDEFIAGLDLFPIILNSININDYDKKDGNIPKYFGGNNNREYVYTETIFPDSKYQAVINDKVHKFFFKSIESCTKDGRVKLDKYETSLINKITGNEESKENAYKVLKYTDEVFNHMRQYIII
ncbi:UNVERIFIED_ORG: sulfatase [Clostridium botulinum]|uniref:sulfatase-like hydrolase/transferase n=1 Tax=Clostridium botulinum TaxID=1491 RepID=UPI000597AA7A|nr:sulfatase-like hydrolase/transferase [Clostridium botulinum]KIL09039.1 sulfatase [Clostridium botulinum]MBY6932731.1 sulfatase-like hydrolase/transferase [Clostridium botulinum]NFL82830.1 tetratricopeptide repeat protein [Clostridium botulinum]NFN10986.1 tetratricopeptide repeat protein [Clostridium botulinum]NFO35881.1 tetratricopeptide repeat protein [Clostridium botulinum]